MAENTHSGEREIGIEDWQLECGTVTSLPESGELFAGTELHRRHWFPWALNKEIQSILYCLVLLLNTHVLRSFH